MIKWLKRDHKKINTQDWQQSADQLAVATETEVLPQATHELQRSAQLVPAQQARAGLFRKIVRGLSKTRDQFGGGLMRLLLGTKSIDQATLEELETILLGADCGLEVTQRIIVNLNKRLAHKALADGQAVLLALRQELRDILQQHPQTTAVSDAASPMVILMVGINGAGKTTTIGKLAKFYQQQGKKVMLAAGDTFRAAAVEQLQAWGQRNDIAVIAQQTGADSASVIYDALSAAKARNIDVLIADTAGRLHTQHHLMDELKKIKRVIQKLDPMAPHETMLVLDASIGQNALNQAREFHHAIGITGITMTKLDGTAKGGILFAIAHELAIAYRYIGVGEGIDDLQPFDAAAFVDAILHDDTI